MKNIFSVAILLTGVLIQGCHSDKSLNTTAASDSLYAAASGDYQGYIRCEDCTHDQLWYILQLKKDGSYMLRRQETPDKPGNKSVMGSWTMTSDSIVYLPLDSEEVDTFYFDGNTLRLKFGEGNAYRAAGTDLLKRTASRDKSMAENIKPISDPDFVAGGDHWSLSIKLQDILQFTDSGKNITFSAPVSDGTVPAGLKAIIYRAEKEDKNLVVTVFDTACERAVGDSSYQSSVSIVYNNAGAVEEYRGCGKYIPDQRLNADWILKSINGEAVDTSSFMKGAPTLVFHLSDQTAGGNNGCNSFFGPAQIKGAEIHFGDLAATTMYCPDMERSDRILKALTNQPVRYEIDGAELMLISPTNDTLIYIKSR